MTRRRQYAAVFYVCGIALLGLALGVFLTGDSEHLFNGLVPLKEPLASSGVRSSFVAVWSEPHAVAVALPAPSGIAEVDAFVQRRGYPSAMDFGTLCSARSPLPQVERMRSWWKWAQVLRPFSEPRLGWSCVWRPQQRVLVWPLAGHLPARLAGSLARSARSPWPSPCGLNIPGGPPNKGMKLTKPGELRSFAAYPRCSADLME
jgi:hypothetical protein